MVLRSEEGNCELFEGPLLAFHFYREASTNYELIIMQLNALLI